MKEALGQGDKVDTRDAVILEPVAQLMCPARSVNYITDRLPQQCLKTPWSSATDDAISIALPSTAVDASRTDSNPSLTSSEGIEVTAAVIFQTYRSQIALGPDGVATKSEISFRTSTIDAQSSNIENELQKTKPSQRTEPDSDVDSPLDNANFLSFEEWKKQNLAKAGQSADDIGGGRAGVGSDGSRPRPRPGNININNALDSLGEDTELEINFGGFVSPGSATQPRPREGAEEKHDISRADKKHDNLPKAHPRGKDAGKTCKERSNYASFDCAATIMKTNREIKGSTSILVENKDSYMLNECSAKNKFFIVELCDDILIDTVVLANFEFFSSSFRTFRVSVSDRYPVKPDKWRDLGTFEARNSREVQAFLIDNPQIWARYLRIEFLTHYGNEYYCPVSLLRVHGTTMMEEFNHDLKASRGEDELEADSEIGVDDESGKSQDIVTAVNLREGTSSGSQDNAISPGSTLLLSEISPLTVNPTGEDSVEGSPEEATATAASAGVSPSPTHVGIFLMSNGTLDMVCRVGDTPEESAVKPSTTIQEKNYPITDELKRPAVEQATIVISPDITSTGSTPTIASFSNSPSPNSSTFTSSGVIESVPSPGNAGQGFQNETRSSSPSSLSPRIAASATQPPASNPTTQESFFKSVHKRLQLLEANSTLSLQYIEEQSRILRDAFSKVEKRQLAKTSTFFETLNATVLTEMREFRSQYDQLWQSTVLELSSQRAQSQQEILALSTRLSLLAGEVVLQRRIAIMQFLLIVACLGLVLFGRSPSSVATYLELPPVVQNAIDRSSANLSRYTPNYDTPNRRQFPTRPSSRYGFFGRTSPLHFREPSEDSRVTPTEDTESLTPE